MSLIRINMRPSRDSLRTFGFLCALFLAALGAAAMRRGDPWVAIAAWLAGAAAAVLAVFAPKLLRWVHVAASCVSFPIGFAVSHLILAGAYYLVLTPTGLLMRCLGRDPLSRKRDPGLTSYWEPRAEKKPGPGYFHQS